MTYAGETELTEQIEQLAAINSDPDAGGITREVFTAEYMTASDHVAGLMTDAGLSVRTDAFGNLWGRSAGRKRRPRQCSPDRTLTRR